MTRTVQVNARNLRPGHIVTVNPSDPDNEAFRGRVKSVGHDRSYPGSVIVVFETSTGITSGAFGEYAFFHRLEAEPPTTSPVVRRFLANEGVAKALKV